MNFRKSILALGVSFSLLGTFNSFADVTADNVRESAINVEDISTHIGNSLGTFRLTGYCSCARCNGI